MLGRAVLKSFGKRRLTLRRRQAENPDLASCYEDRLRDVDAWKASVRAPRAGELLRAEAIELLDAFGRHVEHRTFIAGDNYSLADAVWTVVLARTIQLELDDQWSESTRAWYQIMRRRPSFAAADVWEDQRLPWLLPFMVRSVFKRMAG